MQTQLHNSTKNMKQFAAKTELLAKNVTNTLSLEMVNISNFLKQIDINNTNILSNTETTLTALNFLLGYMTVEFFDVKKSLANVSLLFNYQLEFDRNLTSERFNFHNSQWNKTGTGVEEIIYILTAQQHQLKLLLITLVSLNLILVTLILFCAGGGCCYFCRKVCASTGKYNIHTSPESAHIYAYRKRESAKNRASYLDAEDVELGGIGGPSEKEGVMETEL